LYFAGDYGWKSEKVCKRVMALAKACPEGAKMFVTADDFRHIDPNRG
jgi:hypothetical protein